MDNNGNTIAMEGLKYIAMSKFRVSLAKLRRQVELNEMVCATHYGVVIGYLVSPDSVGKEVFEEMPLTAFRDQLRIAREKLLWSVEGLFLTFHGRRVAAFISPHMVKKLRKFTWKNDRFQSS